MSTHEHWKHKTQMSPIRPEEIKHVAIFDDEKFGHVTLYQTDGKRFAPIRDVSTSPIEHFNATIQEWARAPLLDLRKDKSIPLPTTVDADDLALRETPASGVNLSRQNNDSESISLDTSGTAARPRSRVRP